MVQPMHNCSEFPDFFLSSPSSPPSSSSSSTLMVSVLNGLVSTRPKKIIFESGRCISPFIAPSQVHFYAHVSSSDPPPPSLIPGCRHSSHSCAKKKKKDFCEQPAKTNLAVKLHNLHLKVCPPLKKWAGDRQTNPGYNSFSSPHALMPARTHARTHARTER